MAQRSSSLAASLFGAAAGLGAALPPITCAGGACASCLACVGFGGAAASLLVVGLVCRRLRGNGAQTENASHNYGAHRDSGPVRLAPRLPTSTKKP
jgi:hypothetical protein